MFCDIIAKLVFIHLITHLCTMHYCTYNECVVYNMFYTILFIVNKTKSNLLHDGKAQVHLLIGDGLGAIILVIVEYCMFVLKLIKISVSVKVTISI
jgi:hypothetical protein